jgi:hypothetical protein
LKDLGVDGRIILDWILRNRVTAFGLNASEDGDQLWALVNKIVKYRMP